MQMKMTLDSRFGEIEIDENIDDFTCYILLNFKRATLRIPQVDDLYRLAEVEITDLKIDLHSTLHLRAIERS